MSKYIDGNYYCINNGFNTSVKVNNTTLYIIFFEYKGGKQYAHIINGYNYDILWHITNYQDFDDYFISAAKYRDNQLDSILYDDIEG